MQVLADKPLQLLHAAAGFRRSLGARRWWADRFFLVPQGRERPRTVTIIDRDELRRSYFRRRDKNVSRKHKIIRNIVRDLFKGRGGLLKSLGKAVFHSPFKRSTQLLPLQLLQAPAACDREQIERAGWCPSSP